jgi:PAS domain S-box-containing protein
MKQNITPTNREHKMATNDFIVSKTDLKGRITYANRIFMRMAQYPESSLLNVQHNIIRHPDMPRGVFRFLWDTIKQEQEFFGFVKNLCANGDYYWVFANITPDFGFDGKVKGYYSARRQPPESAIKAVTPLYTEMLAIEKRCGPKEGPEQSIAYLTRFLEDHNTSYRDLALTLYNQK